MFGDFEDPFGLPDDNPHLELAAPRESHAPVRARGPAYSAEEVKAVAAFGTYGDLGKDLLYAWQVRRRLGELKLKVDKRRAHYETTQRLLDNELVLLAAKLPGTVEADDEGRLGAVRKALAIADERLANARQQRALAQDAEPAVVEGERDARLEAEALRSRAEAADRAYEAISLKLASAAGDPAARAPFEADHEALEAESANARSAREVSEARLAEAETRLAQHRVRHSELEATLLEAVAAQTQVRTQYDSLLAESSAQRDAVEKQRAIDALESGAAGAILAAPSLDAYERLRESSRDLAIHVAAMLSVDPASYRQGAEASATLIAGVVCALVALLFI